MRSIILFAFLGFSLAAMQYESKWPSQAAENVYTAITSKCSDDEVINVIRANDWNLNAPLTIFGDTALFAAVNTCRDSVVRWLLENGASPGYVRHIDGATPLCLAAQLGYSGLAGYLIRHKASIHYCLKDGRTPLMIAAAKGDVRIISLLLRHGANKAAVDTAGNTALIYAVQSGRAKSVEVLAAETWLDHSALTLAAALGNIYIVRVLIQRQKWAPENVREALRQARENQHEACAQYLESVLNNLR